LTDKGIARTRAAAKGMRQLGLEPDAILTSPYLRARQTADIVHDVLVPEVPMKRVSSMVPDGDPVEMLEAIVAMGFKAPMCVGHAPSLDDLAGYLVGCEGPVLKLKKAGLCSIEVERPVAGGGRLRAYLPPSLLRGLAG
jgi:phosphohistidine phosphatase